jgi:hypothetical protein
LEEPVCFRHPIGVPAIRSEVEETSLVAIECAAKGMLLDVTTSKLDFSKALALKALARLPEGSVP